LTFFCKKEPVFSSSFRSFYFWKYWKRNFCTRIF